jgi:feruloyl esterase
MAATLASLAGCASDSSPLDCGMLARMTNAPGVTIDGAEKVAAGFVPPGGSANAPVNQGFCRVRATARPSLDSDFKFEVWMPEHAKWNGRFLAAGGGGNSGAIMYSRLADGVNRGFATVQTDNGHQSRDGNIHEQSWAIGHPEKVVDFGYRAQTVTSLAGKELVRTYYGSPANKSYWIGCSQGGGKGLMQAQRFPENFDGIVAGAPIFDWVGSMYSPAWISVKGMRDPALLVPRSKLPLIHNAVLAACDAGDGLADRLLQQPAKCQFDPATLACPAGTDGAQCLTPGEVASMKRYYAPVTVGNRTVFPGFPYGSELSCAWLGRTEPGVTSWSWLWRGPVFENENYDIVANLDADGLRDFDLAKQKLSSIYDAVDPDLTRFQQRGGKLIIWQGMHDELSSHLRTQEYVEAVNARMGAQTTSNFMRSYFQPGVNHCRGGVGPIADEYDLLSKVIDWVEKGQAPDSVLATHLNSAGAVDRTMPICAYPQVARYRGTGSINDAANFSCGAP